MARHAPALELRIALFRKNYAMLTVVFGAAFGFQMGYDTLMNKIWDNNNRGRQWKDIRSKYLEGGDEEDDE
ncbi:Cytochrome b-c1 complex subunit 9, mitochondrial [Sporothrix epigloea]|uniref:Complex III subunit 9 n=1 Tax=Sporothrix epigloea TaxID=1892477 RepID=A0ABP0DJQ0_9PEZI